MLRKLVKTLIPSRDKILFELMIEATGTIEDSARVLNEMVKEDDNLTVSELAEELRTTRTVVVEIASKMDHHLATYFVTPIDRVELHNITTLLLKLSSRIVKIHRYMQIFMEDEKGNINEYIASCTETLRKMTKVLDGMMKAFSSDNYKELKNLYIRLIALDENILEEISYALKKASKSKDADALFLMKVKDVYKGIESAITTCTSVAESIMRVYVKQV